MIIPRSTYRLQLHAGFDFEAATAVLPYLAQLGISHVYCSPIWQARPGSTHGYDVVDHSRISDELGGEASFRDFAASARALGIGLLLDIVPNHMGVFGSDNPWWLDVLANGQASEFAAFFDIDWHPPNRGLDAKLLVPVLGDHYGSVLDAGDLKLAFDAARGELALQYAEHRFPLDLSTYPRVLASVASLPAALRAAFGELPSRDDCDEKSRSVRRARVAPLKGYLVQAAREVGADIEAAVTAINDEPGRGALSDLHDAQAFRLAFWRVASGEINYRRFFDVNTLAAVRIEDERVFTATQSLALDLAADGVVDGLRVDHSDGLHDPAQYFGRLQAGYGQRLAARAGKANAIAQPRASGAVGAAPPDAATPLYLLTEKIVGEDEQLPGDWAVAGTTGYDFMALLNGVFVERSNADRLDRIWRAFTSASSSYASTLRHCKQRVARRSLGAELTVLGNALQHITLLDRRTRDHTLEDMRGAIASVAACMPVYRTYVSGSVSAQDVHFVDTAIRLARRHTEVIDTSIFDVIRHCLLTPGDAAGAAPIDRLRNRFAMRFQQFTSPVAAKGVEDTAFYRYHRLISLNEVGGSPAVFGVAAADFHAANAQRLAHWPHTMLASSTHDNKRSEDVRARLNVLSEQPAHLRLGLRRWTAGVERWRVDLDDGRAPAVHDLYLLYQTLLGSLPANGFAPGELGPYRDRIRAYLEKAVREAKQESSWDAPNTDYEQALQAIAGRVLADGTPHPLLAELLERAADLAWLGALNSVSATLLKLTVPGVPDTYQGTELIDLSLVDPDNRRPVDYRARQALLDDFTAGTVDPAELAAQAQDGRFKLWCLWQLLKVRNQHPELFAIGSYLPMRVRGELRNHVIAFARRIGTTTLLVIASRKFAGIRLGRGVLPVGAVWADTQLRLAARGEATDVLTGRPVVLTGDTLLLQTALETLPVAAILIHTGGAV